MYIVNTCIKVWYNKCQP